MKLKMFKKPSELDGAWEEPGVIGTRIETSGAKITVLWRGAPVLETTFRRKKRKDCTELVPRKRGLRYKNSAKDYAEVTGLFYTNEKLIFKELFPITGECVSTLSKTANSRYGDYTIADGLLSGLVGVWEEENGSMTLELRGDRLFIGDLRTHVRVLIPNGDKSGDFLIVDRDPSVFDWGNIGRLKYSGGKLYTQMLVCDASPVMLTFKKMG